MKHSELHVFEDKASDFCAVIALNNHDRGSALGGCRIAEYASLEDAIDDAKRLAHSMSYKSVISELPHNGGKAVIIKPKNAYSRELLLKKFAECVQALGGKYITTVDSGTTQQDMVCIKKHTNFVTGFLDSPSDATAFGVFKGIQAAIKLQYGSMPLSDLHVAIQGVGSVGYRLAKLCYDANLKLTVCDIDPILAMRCSKEFNADVVTTDDIYDVHCDIFSPCALGKSIRHETLSRLKASIIAGAANDQLATPDCMSEDILYIPDYVINAGGLIYLSLQMQNANAQTIIMALNRLYDRIMMLGEKAKQQNVSLLSVANTMVEAVLSSSCHASAGGHPI